MLVVGFCDYVCGGVVAAIAVDVTIIAVVFFLK